MNEPGNRWVRTGPETDITFVHRFHQDRYPAFATIDRSSRRRPRHDDDHERIGWILDRTPAWTRLERTEDRDWVVRPDVDALETAILDGDAVRIAAGDDRPAAADAIAEVTDHGNLTVFVPITAWSPVHGEVTPDEAAGLPRLTDPGIVVDQCPNPLPFREHSQRIEPANSETAQSWALKIAIDHLADTAGIPLPRTALTDVPCDDAGRVWWDALDEAATEIDPRLVLETEPDYRVPPTDRVRIGPALDKAPYRRRGARPPPTAGWWHEHAFGRRIVVERRPAWRIVWSVV